LVIVKIVRISAVATAFLVLAAVAQASDPFYTSLLTRGVADAQRGDYYRAVKELRIAAFGTVDEPGQYLRAQVYLAHSLEKLGQHGEAAVAVDKASKAERIHGGYVSLAIDPDTRTAFEALAAKSLRPEQLAMVPSFRRGSQPAPIVSTPPPAPAPVQQKPAVVVPPPPPAVVVVSTPKTQTPPPPAPVVKTPVKQTPKSTPPPVTVASAPKPAPATVAPKPAPVVVERPVNESPLVAAARHQPSQAPGMMTTDPAVQIAEAQRLLNEGKILAARQVYVRLGLIDGLSRETALDVAKGLNQTSAWRESSLAYQKAMPFRAGEEIHQFYEAVNRYELGDITAARDLLTRALPALPVTRETSLYKAKILGKE
jgi:outer membrane biosynthesis protein TonB